MASFEFLAVILTGLGLTVSIVYYASILKNSNKTRELQLRAQEHAKETRKIQLLHEINESVSEGDSHLNWVDMLDMKWDNYEDFISKYGRENNPDLYHGRLRIWRRMNFSGLLIRDGLIDTSTYVQYIGDNPPIIWSKFKDIIEELRVQVDNPELYVGIEILAKEIEKYRARKGFTPKASTV